jgi:hypothetical protein
MCSSRMWRSASISFDRGLLLALRPVLGFLREERSARSWLPSPQPLESLPSGEQPANTVRVVAISLTGLAR